MRNLPVLNGYPAGAEFFELVIAVAGLLLSVGVGGQADVARASRASALIPLPRPFIGSLR
jgi:hypothetical protein